MQAQHSSMQGCQQLPPDPTSSLRQVWIPSESFFHCTIMLDISDDSFGALLANLDAESQSTACSLSSSADTKWPKCSAGAATASVTQSRTAHPKSPLTTMACESVSQGVIVTYNLMLLLLPLHAALLCLTCNFLSASSHNALLTGCLPLL